MKVVLDTNVLVSGLLSPFGPPGRILDMVMEGKITICADERILTEYVEVLSRPELKFHRKNLQELLQFIRAEALMVQAPALKIKLADPEDLMFIEVAVKAKAFALITGNKQHFPKSKTQEVPVLSPAEFLEMIKE